MRLIFDFFRPSRESLLKENAMLFTGKTTLLPLFLVLTVALTGCAPKKAPPQRKIKIKKIKKEVKATKLTKPTTLEKGIPVLGRRILNTIAQKKTLILLEPFKDATLYDEIKASAEIERMLLVLGHKKEYSQIHLISTADASDRELEQADYIIKGVISYSTMPVQSVQSARSTRSSQSAQKYYRILASLADRKTGQLTARRAIWVYSVPYGKLELPVITADPQVKQKVLEVINKQKITVSDIKTDARIAKAKAAYRNGQYTEVLRILKKLIASPDGKVLDAYRMLYLASLKMNNFVAAETAFFSMINIGFQNTQKMPLLFLFESDSVEFTPARLQEYGIWIRQLNSYLEKKKEKCMHIIGHTSKQGEFNYNMKLSKERAAYIKERLVQQAQQTTGTKIGKRITVEGKGETETKDGSEPDSDQNMIDRRVEFKLFRCSK
ncbi:MAG: OmpA family protein [Candidatus Electrothrix sp. AW5]|nr:OmpA family protein [Candidatus Electrothrix gigas]